MIVFNDLKHDLLEPSRGVLMAPTTFAATLEAHGLYSTKQFVLRLSPRVHELVDALASGDFGSHEPADLIQAYSTYIHETVHWWQHVGSTAGLIFSLCYPAQFSSSLEHLQKAIAEIGPKKSLKRWADDALRHGTAPSPKALAEANIAVNNALDVEFYKFFAHSPNRSTELRQNQHFESVGHSYRIAYSNTLMALVQSCDLAPDSLPDAERWQAEFDRLMLARHEGFYHGSPITRGNVGLHAIFEGQARFIQLQFLAASGGPSTCAAYAADGYLSGIYVDAFTEFLRLSESEWPETIDNPIVGLFLLICDLSINPTRGFPLDIERFEDFISDVDAGARFALLCQAAREHPEVKQAIQAYSFEEYAFVSRVLADRCGYDHPLVALQAVIALSETAAGQALMAQWASFEYATGNLPIRVMTSHFMDFCRSKIAHPHFFCWAGRALALGGTTEVSQGLFLRHVSLFTDRADTEQIFTRAFAGREGTAIKRMLDTFMASTVLYDLTWQWILRDGPFHYDFRSLTGDSLNGATEIWAKNAFKEAFGHHPDDFKQLK
ncbi:hypothetical protein OHD62_32880 [Mesorhizobium sp. YC-39]|uniref:Uncharacterized protein n=1 Tax=Mesorhizobium robiniae TaxID=559315 RepID=A0ABV2GZS5_9HYPH|nr:MULTISPECIES: hypothetical protein [unclassified Mesorhizobium]MCV3211469.1 hypothetical protein [Mesorhizobium sp. YC-2]MCV3233175.1 hypothetical protein [Mesorhizobium sp. YC-39]MCV3242119.1 hypothetical protein [Mesorhizobium sp. ZC-5]